MTCNQPSDESLLAILNGRCRMQTDFAVKAYMELLIVVPQGDALNIAALAHITAAVALAKTIARHSGGVFAPEMMREFLEIALNADREDGDAQPQMN